MKDKLNALDVDEMLTEDLLAPSGAKLLKFSFISRGLGLFIKLFFWIFLCRFFFLWWLLTSLFSGEASSLSFLGCLLYLRLLGCCLLVDSQKHRVGLEVLIEILRGKLCPESTFWGVVLLDKMDDLLKLEVRGLAIQEISLLDHEQELGDLEGRISPSVGHVSRLA